MYTLGCGDDPLRRDLEAFINRSQECVSGTVRLRMFQGSVRVVGRKSEHSLYSRNTATYGAGSAFDQRLARGFVALWGMQSTEANKLQEKISKKT